MEGSKRSMLDTTVEHKGRINDELRWRGTERYVFETFSQFLLDCQRHSSVPLAKHKLYRRAIIQAIEELHDFNLRSNIDSIRRYVQSTLGPEQIWNDALFMLTIKSLSNEGSIEPLTSVNYGLSPELKRHRAQSARDALEKQEHRHRRSHSIPDNFHQHEYHEKESPVKKMEHAKLKIIPKKIYDGLQ
jgi:hypothetical protein